MTATAAGLAAVFLGLLLFGIFTALMGWATEVQAGEERRAELYDWSQEPDL